METTAFVKIINCLNVTSSLVDHPDNTLGPAASGRYEARGALTAVGPRVDLAERQLATHSSRIAFPEADIGARLYSSVQECSGINTNPLLVDNAEGQLGTLARANAF